MKIVIDLDGTICELKKEGQSYKDVLPNPLAIEKIQKLKQQGHYIIVQTARHMETCKSNLGLVNARVSKDTIDWLDKYQIPFDEIYFGKPNADVYLDDNAKTFLGWDTISDIENFNEKTINLVIPMAGAGSRFAKAGYSLPKPLIDVNGKPMFTWAVSSFDFLNKNFYVNRIFVVLQEHINKYSIDTIIQQYYPDAVIVPLNHITRGQAETVLAAKPYINDYNKLIVFNSDTYTIFNENDFPIDDKKIDGLLSCFRSSDSRYSYAKLNTLGFVEQVVEKVVVSENASNGMYYFRRGIDFIQFAENLITNNKTHNGEFYIGPLYTDLIKIGKRIKINGVLENWILGTPEELDYFLLNYK